LGIPPGQPALYPELGMVYAQAAAVCLDNNQHKQGVCMSIFSGEEHLWPVKWPEVNDQMRRSRNDRDDAARDGAYAVAALLAPELTGLAFIKQSKKGTGFDYWLGKDEHDLFQNSSRLEVSGIHTGNDSQVKSRISRKKKQTQQSDNTGLAAYVCIVEFGKPQSHFLKC
jgi:hypothetical protein